MRRSTPGSHRSHVISPPRRARRWWLWTSVLLGFTTLTAGLVAWGGLSLESLETLHSLPLLLMMVLLPALGLPMTPFYIIAGLRFGIPGGLAFSAIATLLNLLLCYAIAHGRLRPALSSAIERRFPALAGLDRTRGDAWRVTFLIKLVPGVPMFIKHYALGIAGVPRSIYLTVALMTTGPYAVAFVVLGKSALEGDVGQMLVALALVALVVVLLNMAVGYWTRRGVSRPAGSR
ncbi:VTT domain-containing protein [Salinicola corii]|uniref:TVP38/TMEM64 family membrane protein n=1 Tax=Salinicola corii TaxID=2606937 RepID=A0A640WB46_9GAMM|nr:VTT domain-containing protein [Salinicola corii]KAA0017774.1 VTT domain-containing protein [Salinicola corii]